MSVTIKCPKCGDEKNLMTRAGTCVVCDSELDPAACSESPHDFKEEYYGWRCSKCGCFYPNTAPLEAWLNGETHDGQDS